MRLVDPEQIKEFKNLGKRFEPITPDFPPMVLIDTTTKCNLSCVHCPNNNLAEEPGFLGDIDPSLYYKIVDEIAQYPDTVLRPFDGGEPLMRNDLGKLIGYAKERGIKKISINTNGTMLNNRRRRELTRAGLDHIEVSIDAATSSTYRAIRRSPLFYEVVENTLRYYEEAKAYDAQITVSVSFVLQEGNRHELEKFKEFWKDKVDMVSVRKYHQHNGLLSPQNGLDRKDVKFRHPCPYLFGRIIVHHDGKVRFCESDWEAKHSIGDAYTQTLKEIWHGNGYSNLRKNHVAGTFKHPFCKNCTDWKEVSWPGL